MDHRTWYMDYRTWYMDHRTWYMAYRTWDCSWSAIWAKRIVCSHEHVQRNTAGACWAHNLFFFRGPNVLAELRMHNNGRPDVRAASGFTSIRWYEAVDKAMDWQTAHEQR